MNNDQKLKWYFEGGYEQMNKLQEVEFLVECGYSEDGAWDLVYGTISDPEDDDFPYDYYDDYYEE